MQVSYARPAGDEAVETNLYVSNLPKTVTEELLDVIFGKYGTILQKNILRDKLTGQPRGVAFIRYVEAVATAALIRVLCATEFMGPAAQSPSVKSMHKRTTHCAVQENQTKRAPAIHTPYPVQPWELICWAVKARESFACGRNATERNERTIQFHSSRNGRSCLGLCLSTNAVKGGRNGSASLVVVENVQYVVEAGLS